jgi:hypothetical protein
MSFDNTQLTSAFGYDVNNMRFRKPLDGSLPNDTTVKFKRIAIGTKNPDGSLGDLIIPTLRVYSFGLSPNRDQKTGKIDGYSIPLCLFSRDDPTDEQRKWVDTFNNVVEHTKQYILDHKDDIERYDLEQAELKKLNPLYYKREKGKIVDGTGPTLYAKVMQNKKTGTISTPFCDERGNDLDPMTIMDKRCYVTAAIKFESIFIGSRISLQIKVYEARVQMLDSAPRRFLQSMSSSSNNVVMEEDEQPHRPSILESSSVKQSNDDSDDDSGSVNGDDEKEEQQAPPPAPVPASSAKPASRRTIGRKP